MKTYSKLNNLQTAAVPMSNMAQYYQAAPSLPTLCTGQYSILHQERLYLLKSLADEEERGERLSNALERLKSKLDNHDDTDPQVTARKLKQAIKSVRNKISRCQHKERGLSANLENVVAQMEGLKRFQRRRAQELYSQQNQHGLTTSPANAAFALQSPLHPAIIAQMQYMGLGQPNMFNTGGYMPQFSHDPALHHAATAYQVPVGAQGSQWQMAQSQAETTFYSPVSSLSAFDIYPPSAISKEADYEAVSPFSKTESRPWSWPSVVSHNAEVEQMSAAENASDDKSFSRRLSIIDAASSGMRLDRLGSETSVH